MNHCSTTTRNQDSLDRLSAPPAPLTIAIEITRDSTNQGIVDKLREFKSLFKIRLTQGWTYERKAICRGLFVKENQPQTCCIAHCRAVQFFMIASIAFEKYGTRDIEQRWRRLKERRLDQIYLNHKL